MVRLTFVVTAVLSVASTYLAIYGLTMWQQADMFHVGPYEGAGYDKKNFAGVIMFVFTATLSVNLLYTLATVMPHRGVRAGLKLLLAIALIATGIASLDRWAMPLAKCAGVFCINPKKWPPPAADIATKGLPWRVVVGSSAFLSLVPTGVVILGCVALNFIRGRHHHDHETMSLINGSNRYETNSEVPKHSIVTHVCISIATIIGVLIFGLFTTYMPNQLGFFSADGVAHFAMTPCETHCGAPHGFCPEIPHTSTFKTTCRKLTDHLVLKFFPGNVFFYAYLCGMIFMAMVMRATFRGRSMLARTVSFRCPAVDVLAFRGYLKVWCFTVGELLAWAATLTFLVLFGWYWLHDHNFNSSYSPLKPGSGIQLEQRLARGFGQLAVALMSLLMFPIARNSVVHTILGTSFEAFTATHRVLGYLCTLSVFAHMVSWYVSFHKYDVIPFPDAAFRIPYKLAVPNGWEANFTIPIATITGWTMLFVMGVLTLSPIRRRAFEVFYYSHLFMAYALIPVVLWHAAAGWQYLLPGVTLWFVDRLIRMYKSSRAVMISDKCNVSQNVTKIEFHQFGLVVAPGQYVFINIPEISHFQWHPFTVSSCPGDQAFTLHVKSMGPGSWTEELYRLVADGCAFDMNVDGPYGPPIDFSCYSRVVLVAGGIGITPCVSVYAALVKNAGALDKVTMVWTVRDEELCEAFLPTIQSIAFDVSQAAWRVFVTASASEKSGSLARPTMHGSRPNVEAELFQAAEDDGSKRVLVYACGPQELTNEAMLVAAAHGWDFHKEVFSL